MILVFYCWIIASNVNLNVVSLYPDINEYSSLKNWDSSISGNGFIFNFTKYVQSRMLKKKSFSISFDFGSHLPITKEQYHIRVCLHCIIGVFLRAPTNSRYTGNFVASQLTFFHRCFILLVKKIGESMDRLEILKSLIGCFW